MNTICACEFDKFALQHLIRPYQDMLGLGWDKSVKEVPMTYEDLFDRLCADDEWSNLVLDRVSRIGFKFINISDKWQERIIGLIINKTLPPTK